jgi:WD40 repeat protein
VIALVQAQARLGEMLSAAKVAAGLCLVVLALLAVRLSQTTGGSPAADPPAPTLDVDGAPLPAGARLRIGSTRMRHAGWIRSVAIAPDGSLIATSATDRTISLWDPRDGHELRRLPGEPSGSHLALTPDGAELFATEPPVDLWAWSIATGNPSMKLGERAGGIAHNANINGATVARDGERILTWSSDHRVKVWERASGRLLLTYAEHRGQIRSLALSPDGKTAASGEEFGDGTVLVWDTATGDTRLRLKARIGPNLAVNALAFDATGTHLASAAAALQVWSSATGELEREIPLGSEVRAVAFHPDGSLLAATGWWMNRGAIERIAADGGVLMRYEGLSSGATAIALSRDGRILAAGGNDGVVGAWTVADGHPLVATGPNHGAVSALAWSPAGDALALASGDRVRVCDAATGTERNAFDLPAFAVRSLLFDREGRALFACPWTAFGVMRLDLRDGRMTVGAQTGKVTASACLASEGGLVVSSDPGIHLLDREADEIAELPSPMWATSMIRSADGARLIGCGCDIDASGTFTGTYAVRTWDLASRRLLSEVDLGKTGTECSAISADGQVVATCEGSSPVRLLDAATGRIEARLSEPFDANDSKYFAIAFDTDGRRLAAAAVSLAQDGSRHEPVIQVWDVGTRREIARFVGQRNCQALAFSPDGRSLASGGDDSTVLIWTLPAR